MPAADAPSPAATEAAAPTPAVARAAAPAHHAFAPVSRTERPEAACGEASVRFATGSAVLDTAARERLAAYAACVSADETHAVYISGTTDPGDGSRNTRLAGARARAVADYLHEEGLHMDFEVREYRAGSTSPASGVRHVGRSASVTTVPPHLQGH